MKKIYLSLLLTTSSLLCMEKQQSYQYNNPQRVIIPEYALTTSYQSNMQQYSQPGYCEANEPGWEIYDDIANMSYNHNQSFVMQPSPMTEVPLTPVYKPANTNTAQKNKKSHSKTNSSQSLLPTFTKKDGEWILQDKGIHATLDQTYKQWLLNGNTPEAIEVTINQKDKEWLFGTNSLQFEKTIPQALTTMQDLYDQAHEIICHQSSSGPRLSQRCKNQHFVQIITHMNNAKRNGINEGLMGQFAYTKGHYYCQPLLFLLLKKYNATVQTTGEKLPSFSNQKTVCLKEMLNTSNSANTKSTTTPTTDTCDMITTYPAFFQLINTLCDVAQEQLSHSSTTTFMTYIYENNNILLEDYSNGSYKDFKNEFYTKAYDMLQAFLLESGVNCYNLVQMIDKAKEEGDINNENDLIEHMACYTAPQSLATGIKSFFNSSHIDTERKRIVLFCKLAKIYNNKRGFKITPTMNQYYAYCVKKTLGISLPESLANKDLLDENSYAFDEIVELKDATNQLKKLDANEIKELL